MKISFGGVGCDFKATDNELVRHYLWNKATGKPLPCDYLVKECDLYGTIEPWDIWESYWGGELKVEDLYFFTRLKKKSIEGAQIQRRVGPNGGMWRSEQIGKMVKIEGDEDCPQIAWTSQRFCYENRSIPMHDGCWLVQEYSLDPSMTRTDIVLCRLRKNQRKRKFSELMMAEVEAKRISLRYSFS